MVYAPMPDLDARDNKAVRSRDHQIALRIPDNPHNCTPMLARAS